jgi:arylformamidase
MHGVIVCEVSLNGARYIARLDMPARLHLPLEFERPDGPAARQPNHFGAPRARAWPLRAGDFTGDTRAGGSCNAYTFELTPHCNGTHTETAEHLTGERVGIDALLEDTLQPATLISVAPQPPDATREHAAHPFSPQDRLVTGATLQAGLESVPPTAALIVRTLPNDPGKRERTYQGESPAPYFTLEAADFLADRGVRHLLIDLPSLDRAHDEGHLGAHRRFWRLPAGADATPPPPRRHCTITEMVFVEDDLADGLYLLNLQIAPFRSDSAPARVIVFPLEQK